jgi:FkbM family methyltransferase
MQKRGNTFVPDGDTYFGPIFEGVDVFEGKNLATGLKYVTEWECAVDGGAHVGSWTRALCDKFTTVYAFEPNSDNYACLLQNAPQAEARRSALGQRYGHVGLAGGNNSGCWHVTEGEQVTVMPLDEFRPLWALRVGYLKLDVEGYEWYALAGAKKLLRRCSPVVQIEEKVLPHGYACPTARSLLEDIGYKEVDRAGRDVIFVR